MIRLKNVSKNYSNGVEALKNINMEISDGEFVFIVGASGAGKSSFLNVIMGQEKVDSGIVRVGPYTLNTIKRRQLPYHGLVKGSCLFLLLYKKYCSSYTQLEI